MEKIIVDGVIFRRYPDSKRTELKKYFISSPEKCFGYKTKRLHRYLWEKQNGEIPDGYHIHHKDDNYLNNDLSNLELVSPKQHNDRHYEKLLPMWRKNIDKAREKAIEWHKSEGAKEFHKRIARLSWVNKKLYTKDCDVCGKEYKTPFPERSKYCHDNCKATALRRKRGVLSRYQ